MLGKNGAGKTTFIKIITGLFNASEGEITLFTSRGMDVSKHHLLVLDEPINGLEHQGIIEFRMLIERLNKEEGERRA